MYMKRTRAFNIIVLLMLMMNVVFVFTPQVSASNTLYERYLAGNDSVDTAYGSKWFAQLFTVGNTGTNEDFVLTSIKLYCFKYGSPGTVTCHLRNASANKPTGADRDTATRNGNTLGTSAYYVEFNFTGGILLRASTQYAILFSCAGLTSSNSLRLSFDSTSGTYTGGLYDTSTDSGGTWTTYSNYDALFYIYGIKNNLPPTVGLQYPLNSSTAISLKPSLRIYANDTEGHTLTVTWQTNNTGSYITKQVNTSIAPNSTVRYYFSDCTIQFKKYYWRVYVNDTVNNITKWFQFTTTLMNMSIIYSNLTPINNTLVNYSKDYSLISTTLVCVRNYDFNFTFNKSCLRGFNTTTKVYLNNTLLYSWTFINGSKTFEVLYPYAKSLIHDVSYTWSINTTYYNLSYNHSYNFHLHIIMLNLSTCGNTSLTVYNNTNNVTGYYYSYYNSTTGQHIYLNFSGFGSGTGGVTPVVLINNSVNAILTHEKQLRNVTTNIVYVYAGGYGIQKTFQYYQNMTKKAETLNYTGDIRAIVNDSSYIYAAGNVARTVNQYWTSNMTLKAQTLTYGSTIYGLAEDDTYVYAVGGGSTRGACQYWKSNMTLRLNSTTYGNVIKAITEDTNYVYIGGDGIGRIFQYYKSNMSKKAQSPQYGGGGNNIYALINDDNYIYVGGLTVNKIQQYYKSNLTLRLNSSDYGGQINALTQDDTYVYAGGGTTQKIYQFYKSNMTKKQESIGYGGNIYALTHDDTYVYAGGGTTQKIYQFYMSNMTKKAESPIYSLGINAIASTFESIAGVITWYVWANTTGNGTGNGSYNLTINLISSDGLNFSVIWSGDYNSTNTNITVPVNNDMNVLGTIMVIAMNVVLDINQMSIGVLLLLMAFFAILGYAVNNAKTQAGFMMFAGVFSILAMISVDVYFGGIWYLSTPGFIVVAIIFFKDMLLMILYGEKWKDRGKK